MPAGRPHRAPDSPATPGRRRLPAPAGTAAHRAASARVSTASARCTAVPSPCRDREAHRHLAHELLAHQRQGASGTAPSTRTPRRTSASRTAPRARPAGPPGRGRSATWAGTGPSSGMPARRHRLRSASHDSGRNRSASSRAWNRPFATPTWTVTMPLSILPTHPRYCRCTPGVWSPFFRQLVSSITPTVPSGSSGRPSSTSARCRCNRSRADGVVPGGGDQELLERADGGPARQGDRLDALARQVGEQAPAVVVEVGGRPLLQEAAPVSLQVRRRTPDPTPRFPGPSSDSLRWPILFTGGIPAL